MGGITIIHTDSVCEMFPWVSDLESVLCCRKKTMKVPSEYKKDLEDAMSKGKRPSSVSRYDFEHIDLYQKREDGHAFFMPGLLSKVEHTLKSMGMAYTVERKVTSCIRPDPEWSGVGVLRGRQLEVLATIILADGGVIKAATGYGKSHLLRKICCIYPTLNILIVSKSQSVVRELYMSLREDLGDSVGCIFGGVDNSVGRRVVVTTTKSLHKIPAEEVDILLLDECHCVGYNDLATELARFLNCRRFGFTATPYRNDGTEIMMEAYFGPRLIDIDYEESVDSGNVTQIAYTMMSMPSGPNFIEDDINNAKVTSMLFKKRWAYWRNNERNNSIKYIADYAVSQGLQTLIIVETIEHAVKLGVFMPGVPVIHYGKTSEKDFAELSESLCKDRQMKAEFLTYAVKNNIDASTTDIQAIASRYLLEKYQLSKAQKNQYKDDMSSGKLRVAIATLTWRDGVNFPQLNVLIRADGVSSRISNEQIPGRLSRLWNNKLFGLLVDFSDQWTPWAATSSRLREMTYKKNKWKQVDTIEELFQYATKRCEDCAQ